MKTKKTVEFNFTGSFIDIDDLEKIISEARSMGALSIDIDQNSYNEPPYGSSTTTVIRIEESS